MSVSAIHRCTYCGDSAADRCECYECFAGANIASVRSANITCEYCECCKCEYYTCLLFIGANITSVCCSQVRILWVFLLFTGANIVVILLLTGASVTSVHAVGRCEYYKCSCCQQVQIRQGSLSTVCGRYICLCPNVALAGMLSWRHVGTRPQVWCSEALVTSGLCSWLVLQASCDWFCRIFCACLMCMWLIWQAADVVNVFW